MSVLIVGKSKTVINRLKGHEHTAWEIVLNLQGHGISEIGDQSYAFEPGTIICQPPDVFHKKVSEDGFTDIYIQPTHFLLSKAADENGVIVLRDDTEKSFETLMFLAFQTFHKQEANYQLLVDSLFDAMNHLLVSWIQSDPAEKDIERLKNKLIHSFADPEFTLEDILSGAEYCSDHLRRRFKKSTGMTPVEYLTDLRISFAQKLMKQNNIFHYTVAEIGMMSGYYDSRYFSRIFKKKTGLSPLEYLKHAAGEDISRGTFIQ